MVRVDQLLVPPLERPRRPRSPGPGRTRAARPPRRGTAPGRIRSPTAAIAVLDPVQLVPAERVGVLEVELRAGEEAGRQRVALPARRGRRRWWPAGSARAATPRARGRRLPRRPAATLEARPRSDPPGTGRPARRRTTGPRAPPQVSHWRAHRRATWRRALGSPPGQALLEGHAELAERHRHRPQAGAPRARQSSSSSSAMRSKHRRTRSWGLCSTRTERSSSPDSWQLEADRQSLGHDRRRDPRPRRSRGSASARARSAAPLHGGPRLQPGGGQVGQPVVVTGHAPLGRRDRVDGRHLLDVGRGDLADAGHGPPSRSAGLEGIAPGVRARSSGAAQAAERPAPLQLAHELLDPGPVAVDVGQLDRLVAADEVGELGDARPPGRPSGRRGAPGPPRPCARYSAGSAAPAAGPRCGRRGRRGCPRSRRPARSTRKAGPALRPSRILRRRPRARSSGGCRSTRTRAPAPNWSSRRARSHRVEVQAGHLVLVLVGHQLEEPGRERQAQRACRRVPRSARRSAAATASTARPVLRGVRRALVGDQLVGPGLDERVAGSAGALGPPAPAGRGHGWTASGSAAAARPQRKARTLSLAATPFSAIAASIAAGRHREAPVLVGRAEQDHVGGQVVAGAGDPVGVEEQACAGHGLPLDPGRPGDPVRGKRAQRVLGQRHRRRPAAVLTTGDGPLGVADREVATRRPRRGGRSRAGRRPVRLDARGVPSIGSGEMRTSETTGPPFWASPVCSTPAA